MTSEPIFPLHLAVAALFAALAVIGFALYQRVRMRLARAEARLVLETAAIDALPQARLVTDQDGRAIIANGAWTREFGFDTARPLAALESRIKGDADALAQLARLKSAAASGGTARGEFQWRRGEGAEWRDVSVAPLGRLAGFALWGMEDITARKEMEQIVREEQEKLIDFLENAPIGFYSVDENGRFLFVNNTLAGWLGHTPEEITTGGRLLQEFVVGAEPRRLAHSPFRDGADQERGEVLLRGRNGVTFTGYVAQTVVRAENGSGLRTRSLVRDLTIEREWADALKQSEQRFHRFFEEAPLGIVLLDIQDRIGEHNAAFAKMLGLGDGNAVGRPLSDFTARSDRETLASQTRRAVSGTEEPAPFELTLERGGAKIVVSALMRRLEEGGEASGLILHLVDITEQKALEAQFLQSQKMEAVGQLAGGVAHDFNNLLTAMIGFCDLLLMRHRPGDQSFADIMQIRQNANRAANLVRQLLAFSRQQTLQPRVLNITDVLAELSNLLRRLIGATIELKMVHGRDLGLVRVDQGQLEQVIINLAVNARDAMAEGGTLTIHTFNVPAGEMRLDGLDAIQNADYVAIAMTDTGCGIAQEHLDKIFEPFFTTKEVGTGTGLGLSTVYGIIKQTGGLIDVESEVEQGRDLHHLPAAPQGRCGDGDLAFGPARTRAQARPHRRGHRAAGRGRGRGAHVRRARAAQQGLHGDRGLERRGRAGGHGKGRDDRHPHHRHGDAGPRRPVADPPSAREAARAQGDLHLGLYGRFVPQAPRHDRRTSTSCPSRSRCSNWPAR